jgi:hypothetical protein
VRLAEGAGAKQDIGFVHIIVLHRRGRPVASNRPPAAPTAAGISSPFTF